MAYIIAIIASFLLLIVDQVTKYFVTVNMTLATSSPMPESIEFIPGLIDFVYIHNKGGAWGMLQGHTWFLLSVTMIVMLICITMLIKYGLKDKLLFWALSLVLTGGLGNMIDRIFRNGNVVDFIHLHFMPDFPIFNIADCCVVIGAGLLILYFVIDLIKEAKLKKNLAEKLPEDMEKHGEN